MKSRFDFDEFDEMIEASLSKGPPMVTGWQKLGGWDCIDNDGEKRHVKDSDARLD